MLVRFLAIETTVQCHLNVYSKKWDINMSLIIFSMKKKQWYELKSYVVEQNEMRNPVERDIQTVTY